MLWLCDWLLKCLQNLTWLSGLTGCVWDNVGWHILIGCSDCIVACTKFFHYLKFMFEFLVLIWYFLLIISILGILVLAHRKNSVQLLYRVLSKLEWPYPIASQTELNHGMHILNACDKAEKDNTIHVWVWEMYYKYFRQLPETSSFSEKYEKIHRFSL